MKWKNVIISILGGLAIIGASCLSVQAQSTVKLRNKAAGHTREQAMFEALKDRMFTDGSFDAIRIGTSSINNTPVGSETASTAAFTTLSSTNAYTVDGAIYFGTGTLVMSSEATGHGTITPSATGDISIYVTTDDTGDVEDHLDIGDGITAGQQLSVTLASDDEANGLLLIPGTKMAGTSTLLKDAGNTVNYEWTGSSWNVKSIKSITVGSPTGNVEEL